MSKPRIVKDYVKLPVEIKDKLKIQYPYGFQKKLILFKNASGKFVSALPYETDDFYYLVRMTSEEAMGIVKEDDDYDEDGILKEEKLEELTEKYEGDESELND